MSRCQQDGLYVGLNGVTPADAFVATLAWPAGKDRKWRIPTFPERFDGVPPFLRCEQIFAARLNQPKLVLVGDLKWPTAIEAKALRSWNY